MKIYLKIIAYVIKYVVDTLWRKINVIQASIIVHRITFGAA